jgi:hypothetical protein
MIAPSRFTGRLPEFEFLDWDRPVLAACDLDRLTVRCRRIRVPAGTVVTPLATDWLAAYGVKVDRPRDNNPASPWVLAQEKPSPLIASAVDVLRRESLTLRQLSGPDGSPLCHWARSVAGEIGTEAYVGGVMFTSDPGLVCCVANKIPGVRAATANNVFQAARATLTLAANLLAVEMPGRTFHEVKGILGEFCRADRSGCPTVVSLTLTELEQRVHRT